MTEIIWPFDVSGLEKLRFWSSTLHHQVGILKFHRYGYRLRKAPFLATGNTVVVWTLGLTREKRCVFNFIRLSRPRKESRNVSRSLLRLYCCVVG